MAKSTGKRGHRSKAEDVLSRKATQHHDFVGEAEPDRTRSRAVEQGRIRREQRPAPVKTVVHLSERAIGLALWPVRVGVHLAGRVLQTPLALLRLLVTNRGTA